MVDGADCRLDRAVSRDCIKAARTRQQAMAALQAYLWTPCLSWAPARRYPLGSACHLDQRKPPHTDRVRFTMTRGYNEGSPWRALPRSQDRLKANGRRRTLEAAASFAKRLDPARGTQCATYQVDAWHSPQRGDRGDELSRRRSHGVDVVLPVSPQGL